jgi:hypothetical protein
MKDTVVADEQSCVGIFAVRERIMRVSVPSGATLNTVPQPSCWRRELSPNKVVPWRFPVLSKIKLPSGPSQSLPPLKECSTDSVPSGTAQA